MAERTSLKKTISINAPVTAVWEALTDRGMIKQYFFGVETSGDWKEGHIIFYKGEWQGKKYEGKGKVLQVEDQKMLRHSYWSNMSGLPDLPEIYHIITYGLSAANGHPELNLKEENLTDEVMKERSDKLWDTVFDNLRNLVEN